MAAFLHLIRIGLHLAACALTLWTLHGVKWLHLTGSSSSSGSLSDVAINFAPGKVCMSHSDGPNECRLYETLLPAAYKSWPASSGSPGRVPLGMDLPAMTWCGVANHPSFVMQGISSLACFAVLQSAHFLQQLSVGTNAAAMLFAILDVFVSSRRSSLGCCSAFVSYATVAVAGSFMVIWLTYSMAMIDSDQIAAIGAHSQLGREWYLMAFSTVLNCIAVRLTVWMTMDHGVHFARLHHYDVSDPSIRDKYPDPLQCPANYLV